MTRALTLLLALLALTGCRYTFVPLVPPLVQGNFPPRLAGVALTRQGDALLLSATLTDTLKGYLTCTWFDGSAKLGQESQFLDPQGRRAVFKLSAPTHSAGYRAILSFQGSVLRQVEFADADVNPSDASSTSTSEDSTRSDSTNADSAAGDSSSADSTGSDSTSADSTP